MYWMHKLVQQGGPRKILCILLAVDIMRDLSRIRQIAPLSETSGPSILLELYTPKEVAVSFAD